jgi:hypothetical protein
MNVTFQDRAVVFFVKNPGANAIQLGEYLGKYRQYGGAVMNDLERRGLIKIDRGVKPLKGYPRIDARNVERINRIVQKVELYG